MESVSGANSERKVSFKSASSGRGSSDVAEKEELRVAVSMLTARNVFQKLVLYTFDQPNLKPLLDSLRKGGHRKIGDGPWITKLREKTAEIKARCPDGRPSLRAVRTNQAAEARNDHSDMYALTCLYYC